LPILALIAITAIWGVTFVQVKDAVALYPIFSFLAVRFAIASAALGIPFAGRLGRLDRRGLVSGVVLGSFLAGGYALQTLGLARTTVTSAGFITGMFVPLTPVFAALIFRDRIGWAGWAGAALATLGLALLSGVELGTLGADLLVLGGAAAFALHIVFTSRFAPRYDIAALALAQMLVAFAAFGVIALVAEPLEVPRGWTVWGALVVTGVFASALAYLIQVWAQRRMAATRIAIVFSLETVWAGFFGYLLAEDRLGLTGWGGCALILAGIVVAEPAAADVLTRLPRRGRSQPDLL
jgi:drug/metabolite transporter (DMT)-like permease